MKFRLIPPMSERQTEAFLALIPKGAPEECWPWLGRFIKGKGYGTFSIYTPGKEKGTEYNATRIAYKLFTGLDPAHLWVLHKCDNPPCCNPSHLFLGTYQDNVDDMVKKRRHMHGDRHYLRLNPRSGGDHNRAAFTNEQARHIRTLYATGNYTQKHLGEMHGVTKHCIQRIVAGKGYKHI